MPKFFFVFLCITSLLSSSLHSDSYEPIDVEYEQEEKREQPEDSSTTWQTVGLISALFVATAATIVLAVKYKE